MHSYEKWLVKMVRFLYLIWVSFRMKILEPMLRQEEVAFQHAQNNYKV